MLRDLGAGGIVLLHDSPLYAERDDAEPTTEAVAPIVAAARAKNLQPVTLATAFDAGQP